ncbi:MAG: PrgI family protein [Clostridiales bacterium]|nr:PrgI family protein [Clostridiales bacterium]
MAIEVNVPDEIEDYKEKIVAGLSVRQLICGGIALGIGVPACVLMSISGVNDYITMIVTMAAAIPPFCIGFINIKGYRFEVYAKIKLRTLFTSPTRPYATDIEANILPIEAEEFRFDIQKMIKDKERAEAEQKMKKLEEQKGKGGFLFIVFDKIKGFRIKQPEPKKGKERKKPKRKRRLSESDLIEIREKDNKRKRKTAAKALKAAERKARSPKPKEKETA